LNQPKLASSQAAPPKQSAPRPGLEMMRAMGNARTRAWR
jgi:hypothetical protein